MHFKGWLGTSLVLILALSATMALFYYWDNENKSAMQALQNRVNEMEMGRVMERGGKRLYQQTLTMSRQVEKWLQRYQNQVERLADEKVFRLPGKGEAKQARLEAQLKTNAQWIWAYVTDVQGARLAAAGTSPPPSAKVDSKRFNQARVQRSTTMGFVTADKTPILTIMAPCLSNTSAFLGVLNVAIKISPQDLKKNAGQRGIFTLVGDNQGKIYISSDQNHLPEQMEQLINQPQKKTADLIQQAGPKFFKAHWKNKNYILAVEPLEKQPLAVYGLMPVSGFEKALASSAKINDLFNNPIILGGYAVILLITLLLLALVSGGNLSPLGKINRQLAEQVAEQELPRPLAIKSKGPWEQLVFYINTLIEKTQSLAAAEPAPAADNTAGLEEAEHRHAQEKLNWENEMDELRTQLYQAQQIQESGLQEDDGRLSQAQQQLEELQNKNEKLQQALTEAQLKVEQAAQQAAAPAISAEDLEMVEIVKQSGALRIEAITHMSEDLKATLLVIKNYISSILSSEEGKITDAQQEFLGDVINKSARLERQINDLLDISHMESEGTEWYTTATDLVAMLQDVVLNMQPQADTKQIKIATEIQSHLPLIKINSDRMGQVFINLVQHAIKITPFSGEVKITATETLSDVVVKVRDGGTPLSQAQIKHVFNAYNGQDSKAGSDYAGTGLRFAIINQIVKLHHGFITMRGLPESGNEAVVTMPKSKVATAESTGSSPHTMTFSATTMDMPPQVENEPSPPAQASPKVVNPMEAYEVKAIDEKKEKPDKTAKDEDKDGSPYDLSAFMGNLGKDSESSSLQVPGDSEDLDELLKDIENINGQLDS